MIMSTFVYLREFSNNHGIDFSTLTLQQRLFMSAVLTKYRYDDKRTLAQIIFNSSECYSKANFEAYDKLITSIIDDELGEMTTWIKKNAKELSEDRKSKRTEDRYLIKGIIIDQRKIYAMRNGAHGSLTMTVKKNGIETVQPLPQIAWKAFALAAALSNIGVLQWRMLNIYNWVVNDITEQKVESTNKTILKRNIEKWLRIAKISGEFEKSGDYFYVDVKKMQKDECSIRGGSRVRMTKKDSEWLDMLQKATDEAK